MADYEDTNVSNLIINNMSQEKYDELAAAGELDPTQVYLTPTEESGGASLPDQTGNAGKFLMTDGENASWGSAIKNIVEVLPTADNGYVTVKNFGNNYVEITGYASIGTVGAGTGSEIQIDLPAGYTMANANYWVNIAPTSETTMFDLKAEAKARSTTHFMVAYKNEDDATGLTNAGVYWEIRGMLATA